MSECDPRNKLNDLSSKEWVLGTKSFWGADSVSRDSLKRQHPATFAEGDVEKLIRFFTKYGERVLDPFCGVGSTLVACLRSGRHGVGVELIQRWADLSRERIAKCETVEGEDIGVQVVLGDARRVLVDLDSESFDFVVTSPPYWGILNKPLDHKSKQERSRRGLATKYSDNPDDLANIPDYQEFLRELQGIFRECLRLLRPSRYLAVIASDFRHGPRLYPFHADLSALCEDIGYVLKGLCVIVQDHKRLYPYGYPYSYVPNIHHQNVVILQRSGE